MNHLHKNQPATNWPWHKWVGYFCWLAVYMGVVFLLSDKFIGRHRSFNEVATLALIVALGVTIVKFLHVYLAKKR